MGDLSKFHEKGGALDTVACCICGSAPDPVGTDYNGNRIAACAACELMFVSPRAPFQALLEHVYDSGYCGSEMREKGVEDAGWAVDRLGRFKGPPGTLLDLGAGGGALLEAAKMRGWSIEGTEVQAEQSKVLAEKLGCRMHTGTIETLDGLEGRFDAVTFSHVLEHVPDPAKFLQRAAAALKPGGVAYALFPNTGGFNDRWKSFLSRSGLKSRPWKHLAADHHLWFFTLPTVRRLCEKLGLEVVSLTSVYPPRKRSSLGPLAAPVERAGLAPWIEFAFRAGR